MLSSIGGFVVKLDQAFAVGVRRSWKRGPLSFGGPIRGAVVLVVGWPHNPSTGSPAALVFPGHRSSSSGVNSWISSIT